MCKSRAIHSSSDRSQKIAYVSRSRSCRFFAELNPCIKLLDARLHTVDTLRRTVLFTAILAVTAKHYRPDLYPAILDEAHRQVGRGMADCNGGIELVQAICLVVFWKVSAQRARAWFGPPARELSKAGLDLVQAPTDATGWLKIGFAIRLAYSLKLHTRRTTALPADPVEAWAVLDRERTWFNLTCAPRHRHGTRFGSSSLGH